MNHPLLSLAFIPATTLATAIPAASAELAFKPVLDRASAKRIVDAAAAEARRRGATVVIAVVDDGGYPAVRERLDDTQVASSEVAVAKARTAAIFRRPSKVFEDQVRDRRIAALTLPGAIPLQGDLPRIDAPFLYFVVKPIS